ncbi:SET domain-containing protein [Testicularia cyperi]|uniref:SET domain-containing protein n=1 Tax=Testicularia cyperi TaxID=1882483 RepID=A0A317XJ97_9BASI|nr:SET domain-containing protein [Testicularia cyperi]
MTQGTRERQTTTSVEASFLRWFRQSGGSLDPRCHIGPIEGMGRGMTALHPIKAGETLFVIPRHLLLNLSTSSLAQKCSDAEAAGLAPLHSKSTSMSMGSDNETSSGATALTWSEISKLGWLPLILAMMYERRRGALLASSTAASCHTVAESDHLADISMESLDTAATRNTNPVDADHNDNANDNANDDDDDDDEGTNEQGVQFRAAPRPHGQQAWTPYFDIMPVEFSTPMFWGSDDLEHLRSTSIADKIARDEAEADYYTKALPFIRAYGRVFFSQSQDGQHDAASTSRDVEVDVDAEIAKWYSLDTYHVMGSRILSRSFHVKARRKAVDGKTVDMDEDDDDGDGDQSEAEILDEEGEIDAENGAGAGDDVGDNGNAHAGDDTQDDVEKDDNVNDDDADDDDDDDDDEEEEESENIADISMTPMADMLNARFESDNARLFYKSHVLEMRATRHIAAGAQIFNTYADPPNSDLLRRYGHVDEPNGSDVVEVDSLLLVRAAKAALSSLALSPQNQNQQQKQKQEQEQNGTNESSDLDKDLAERLEWACSSLGIDEVFILGYLFTPSPQPPHRPQPERPTAKELKSAATGGGIPEEMIALARILCMSRESFLAAREKGKGPSARVEAQEVHSSSASTSSSSLATTSKTKTKEAKGSTSQKITVAAVLTECLNLKLSEYPNGPSTDLEESLLYGPQTREIQNANHRNALVVRLGEKRILHDHKRTLQYVLDRIKDAEKLASSNKPSSTTNSSSNKRKSDSKPSSKGLANAHASGRDKHLTKKKKW